MMFLLAWFVFQNDKLSASSNVDSWDVTAHKLASTDLKFKLNTLMLEVTLTLDETQQSLQDIYATQEDAVMTLAMAFIELQGSIDQ